jgi:glucose/arabinose dehydrogenase
MPLRLSAMLAALVAVALFASPASAALHLSPIGTFTSPVYVTAPPGNAHSVFVVEQAGRIIEVRDGQIQDPPFLDITSSVKSGGEQGLLSMAFAPDYATSGRYYVYYTAPRAADSNGSVITVEEFSPTEHHVVFTVDHPTNGNHNGGQIQFGPDGMLYAGTGDGGSSDDPPNNAQNPTSNLGKLLRVDPLASDASHPSSFASGLRNPFRFSFDRQTGDLTIGDVGQNTWEEVDFSSPGTAAGRNYGWRCREGMHANPNVSCTVPGAVDPVLEKDHSTDGFCAIIGGYVVRDASLGSLAGRYVYGDNCAHGVRSVTLPAATDNSATGLTVDGLSSFGENASPSMRYTGPLSDAA